MMKKRGRTSKSTPGKQDLQLNLPGDDANPKAPSDSSSTGALRQDSAASSKRKSPRAGRWVSSCDDKHIVIHRRLKSNVKRKKKVEANVRRRGGNVCLPGGSGSTDQPAPAESQSQADGEETVEDAPVPAKRRRLKGDKTSKKALNPKRLVTELPVRKGPTGGGDVNASQSQANGEETVEDAPVPAKRRRPKGDKTSKKAFHPKRLVTELPVRKVPTGGCDVYVIQSVVVGEETVEDAPVPAKRRRPKGDKTSRKALNPKRLVTELPVRKVPTGGGDVYVIQSVAVGEETVEDAPVPAKRRRPKGDKTSRKALHPKRLVTELPVRKVPTGGGDVCANQTRKTPATDPDKSVRGGDGLKEDSAKQNLNEEDLEGESAASPGGTSPVATDDETSSVDGATEGVSSAHTRSVPCAQCGAVFGDRGRLMRHVQGHRPGMSLPAYMKFYQSAYKSWDSPPNNDRIVLRVLPTGSVLRAAPTPPPDEKPPSAVAIGDVAPPGTPKSALYMCVWCQKAGLGVVCFKDIESYGRHAGFHNKRTHKCCQCDLGFSTVGRLKRHRELFHRSCSVCGAVFTTSRRLRRHMESHDQPGKLPVPDKIGKRPYLWASRGKPGGRTPRSVSPVLSDKPDARVTPLVTPKPGSVSVDAPSLLEETKVSSDASRPAKRRTRRKKRSVDADSVKEPSSVPRAMPSGNVTNDDVATVTSRVTPKREDSAAGQSVMYMCVTCQKAGRGVFCFKDIHNYQLHLASDAARFQGHPWSLLCKRCGAVCDDQVSLRKHMKTHRMRMNPPDHDKTGKQEDTTSPPEHALSWKPDASVHRAIPPEKAPQVTTRDATPLVTTKNAAPLVATKDAAPLVTTKDATPLVTTGNAAPVVTAKDATPLVTTGDAAPLVTTGDAAPLVTTGDAAPLVTTNDAKPLVTTKDARPLVTTKDATPMVTTKDATPLVTTKGSTPLVTTGDATPMVTAKDATPLVTTGDAAPLVTAKDATPLVTTGDAAPLVTTGDARPLVTTKDATPLVTTKDATPLVTTKKGSPTVRPKPGCVPHIPLAVTEKTLSSESVDRGVAPLLECACSGNCADLERIRDHQIDCPIQQLKVHAGATCKSEQKAGCVENRVVPRPDTNCVKRTNQRINAESLKQPSSMPRAMPAGKVTIGDANTVSSLLPAKRADSAGGLSGQYMCVRCQRAGWGVVCFDDIHSYERHVASHEKTKCKIHLWPQPCERCGIVCDDQVSLQNHMQTHRMRKNAPNHDETGKQGESTEPHVLSWKPDARLLCATAPEKAPQVTTKDAKLLVATGNATPLVASKDATPLVTTKDATPLVTTKDVTPLVTTKDATPLVATGDAAPLVPLKHVGVAPDGSALYMCVECRMAGRGIVCFKTNDSYQLHISIHNKPHHKCSKCGRFYPSAERLKQHEALHVGQNARARVPEDPVGQDPDTCPFDHKIHDLSDHNYCSQGKPDGNTPDPQSGVTQDALKPSTSVGPDALENPSMCCCICAANFPNLEHLRSHQLKYHMQRKFYQGKTYYRSDDVEGCVKSFVAPQPGTTEVKQEPPLKLEALDEPPSVPRATSPRKASPVAISDVNVVPRLVAPKTLSATPVNLIQYWCARCKKDDGGKMLFKDINSYQLHMASHKPSCKVSSKR